MLARYEKLEEFVEAITEECKKNKELPVYVSIVRTQDEENTLSSQMYVQVPSSENSNIVLTHCYSDLPAINVVAPTSFAVVFGETETAVAAKNKYDADFLKITNQIIAEKEKLIAKLKQIGFTKFVNALLQ